MEVGDNIRQARLAQGLTLAQLAERSGVSKGMLSDVECCKKNPTIRTLHQIARGLDCTISDLLGVEGGGRTDRTLQKEEPRAFVDQGTGIVRCLLSPSLLRRGIQVVRYEIPAGAEVEWAPEMPGVFEHVTVLEGTLRLSTSESSIVLEAGEAIAYPADEAHGFAAMHEAPVRLMLVMDSTQVGRPTPVPSAPPAPPIRITADQVGRTASDNGA